VPTLSILEDGTYDFTGIRAVNIKGSLLPSRGAQVTIKAATLVKTQQIVFVNTSLRMVGLQLNNSGSINGIPGVYFMPPGQMTLSFDGTNLV
jgi:hypothetical protein